MCAAALVPHDSKQIKNARLCLMFTGDIYAQVNAGIIYRSLRVGLFSGDYDKCHKLIKDLVLVIKHYYITANVGYMDTTNTNQLVTIHPLSRLFMYMPDSMILHRSATSTCSLWKFLYISLFIFLSRN